MTREYTIDPANAICVCGHWTEEHWDNGINDKGCEGCAVGGTDPYEHGFTLDVEMSSPENIADRGGDPAAWPQYVKDYFGPEKMAEWAS